MKRKLLPIIAILLSTDLLLTGCDVLHQQAVVSFDESHNYFDGKSVMTIKGEHASENFGYIASEGISMGIGSSGSSNNQFDQADPTGLNSGPSDGSYNFLPMPMSKPAELPDNFFTVSEEIEFIGKGYKETDEGGTTNNSLYYLEIPVMINYNHKVQGDSYFHGGLGIYAAAGLFGHYSGTYQGQSMSGSLKFGSNADFDRMDYGLIINAGYNITKKIDVFLSYDLGLKNIYSPDDKLFNRTAAINLGYRFK
ncbi:MAG TPA: porin family protein [Mucilaginibacter sp.]|nr:porin family protein [Mucilaginibacter sp.]